jgi:uncharacterized coiled-coil protein SlyX
MIQNRIEELEKKIAGTSAVNEETRGELLKLVAEIKRELANLPQGQAEQAQSITGFVMVTTHEAVRAEKNPQLLRLSSEGLRASVNGFENTHPGLVQAVNAFCRALSNLGI